MMIKRRLASISALGPIEASLGAIEESLGTANGSSDRLRTPTVDERAALYLRAMHERDDFTKEEYSRARELILDAMAANITAKSKAPEEFRVPFEYAKSEELLEDRANHALPNFLGTERNVECELNHQLSRLSASDTPFTSAIHRTVHVRNSSPALEESVTAAAVLRMPNSSSSRRRIDSFSSRKRPIRIISNWTAAGIAAGVVLVLVTAVPGLWLAANRNSMDSPVAVQTSSFDEVRSKIAGGLKQVETTAAPLVKNLVPTDQIDMAEVADLLKRGRELVAIGNIDAARSVLKQAAEEGDASAALELGATYDPTVLNELRARAPALKSVAADIMTARNWYQRAMDLGSGEAAKRIERLPPPDR